MLKRFAIGFAVGVGLMYWYINYSEQTIAEAVRWMNRSASNYSDNTARRAVESELGD